LGIELVPVDAPTYFTDPSPTAELVRQILGAVSQFEKAALVAKLKHARDTKREATGRWYLSDQGRLCRMVLVE
jgi:DNA invertase Pin-like site-specific DNA recombinase